LSHLSHLAHLTPRAQVELFVSAITAPPQR
jgi:hypothetical protein